MTDDRALRCMGISESESLTLDALDELGEIAEGCHRRAGMWPIAAPPVTLAASEGVRLVPGGDDEALCGATAFWRSVAGEDGLWQAHALAGVLLVRRRWYSDLRAWALTTDLLVPEWSLDGPLPWAPGWLVQMRARVRRVA